MRRDENLGTVGEKTTYKTVNGEEVHVGDLVKVLLNNEGLSTVDTMVKGNTWRKNGKYFIMGIEMACNDIDGTIKGRKILEIVKPYTALKEGDELGLGDIKVVADKLEKKETAICDDFAKPMVMGILYRAIKDLKESGKDYFGLDFIRMMMADNFNK